MADKKVPTPKTKTQAFADYKKKNGRHHRADPRHPMNSESTGPSTTVKTKRSGGAMKKKSMGYKNGGKTPTPKPLSKAMREEYKRNLSDANFLAPKSGKGSLNDPAKDSKAVQIKAFNKTLKENPKAVKRLNEMNKKSGGVMKKKAMGYEKGGKVSSAQQAAALKKLMDKAGPNIFKGGSGAGNADMEKMIKKIASVSGKKKGGVIKKKAGGAMKPVPAGKKGLAKLPTSVRNKMGYAKKGGAMKKAAGYKSGGSCRGGGSATRGKGYSKA